MGINFCYIKAWLSAAALCISSFFLLFSPTGSYASELIYTVQTQSFSNAAEKKEPVIDVKADGGEKAEMLVPANSEPMEADNLKPPPSLKRDLFSSGNSMHKLKRKAVEKVLEKLELKATIIDGQDPLAIIGDEVLGVGGSVEGLEVTAIENNEVVLSKGESQYILRMKKE